MQAHAITYTTDPEAHDIRMPCHCTVCARLLSEGDLVAVDIVQAEGEGTMSDLIGRDEHAALLVRCGMEPAKAARLAAEHDSAPTGWRICRRVAMCPACAPAEAHD